MQGLLYISKSHTTADTVGDKRMHVTPHYMPATGIKGVDHLKKGGQKQFVQIVIVEPQVVRASALTETAYPEVYYMCLVSAYDPRKPLVQDDILSSATRMKPSGILTARSACCSKNDPVCCADTSYPFRRKKQVPVLRCFF
jgi:hypothetical protein